MKLGTVGYGLFVPFPPCVLVLNQIQQVLKNSRTNSMHE